MRFVTVYRDNPWEYKAYSGPTIPQRKAHGTANNHYDTLSDAELIALPFADIAEKDCLLFDWVTWPCLESAFAVNRAHKFKYKTCAFLWIKLTPKSMNLTQYKKALIGLTEIKTLWGGLDLAGLKKLIEAFPKFNVGLAHWTLSNTEACLLFGKGQPKRKSKKVRQLVIARRGRHSAKPDEMYRRIERLAPGPYVEIFARQHRPGWVSIGDGVDGMDIRYTLPLLARAKDEAEFEELKRQLYQQQLAAAESGDKTVIRDLALAKELYGKPALIELAV
jgi:N6-adenosine-specific RNA methylase IME4